jgi:hypothetical protein
MLRMRSNLKVIFELPDLPEDAHRVILYRDLLEVRFPGTPDEGVVEPFIHELGGDGEVSLGQGLLNLLQFVVNHGVIRLEVLCEFQISLCVLVATHD